MSATAYAAQAIISIHASLTGGDGIRVFLLPLLSPFQSTPPSREATQQTRQKGISDRISIHASLTGGDMAAALDVAHDGDISIHASLTGGDRGAALPEKWELNFNPRLPHGRRLSRPLQGAGTHLISIHASLTGGDTVSAAGLSMLANFNPRLPHGRRHTLFCTSPVSVQFQSTPPSREAT